MLTAIVILSIISQIILALFVYLKGRKKLTNILFTGVILSTLAWAVMNYVSIRIIDSNNLIYIVRTILFFVVIQNMFFYLFARTFPDSSWRYSKKWLAAYLIFTAVTALATLSPFVFTTVVVKDGLPSITAGPAIVIFVGHTAFSTIVAFTALIRKVRHSKGVLKGQLQLLLIASILNWIIVPITSFVFTSLLKTTVFIVIGPLYSLIFAGLVAYTIVSQKLFDIRAVAVRSVTYVLLIATVAIIYGVGIYGFINVVFVGSDKEVLRQVLSIALIFPLLIGFQPLKSFFDRVTNRIFYQDAYETQDLISEFNKAVVSTIDLEQLLLKVAEIIDRYIKSGYCEFGIRTGEDDTVRVVGNADAKANKETLQQLRAYAKKYSAKVIVDDELENEDADLKRLLDNAEIGMLVRITSDKAVEGVGYLILGFKKNGSPYTSQDRKAVDIMANGLVIAIQNALAFEEIQKFNITLQQKVEDATKELKKTNDKLRILDQTKDEFISMASHQLRTPLTSVKGYVSMVLDGDAGKLGEQQKKLLNQAFVSSQRMVYLIADLLNVSRLRTGKFVIENKPTNLADLVEGEVEQLIETAKGRNLTLKYDKPKSFTSLMLDETKIRQVVMNFADNAIHYTPSGGKITVKVEETPQSIEYTVTDTGLGVPKNEQHHLFAKFYRAKNAKKARPDGTGLGLFMAKKVIIAQGGSVIFKSQEGKGSTFGFTFPKKKLAVPEITPK